MKRLFVVCLTFGLVTSGFSESSLPVAEPASMGMVAQELSKIEPAMSQLLNDGKLAGGNVLVLRRGHVVYQKSFGYRDLEGQLPMEMDTIFRIYSMTKALSSAAALMLCEEGKMSLDDPIGLHLKAMKNQSATRSTTVRDLLRHTSGYIRRPGGDMPLQKMVTTLAAQAPDYEPGSQWVYGVSTDLLAAVVEAVDGQPFDQCLAQRLIEPLGMSDTGFTLPESKVARLAVHYRVEKGKLVINDPAQGSSYIQERAFKGGGSGLVSTITDYAKFLQMIANGGVFQGKRYLREDSIMLMKTNQLPRAITQIAFGSQQRFGTGFGLGFCVKYDDDDRWNPDGALGEYGWGGAASTHYWISPRDELVVVTMEQTMPYNWNMEDTLKPIIYGAIKKRSH